jgi:hypothetical protein
MTNTRTIREYLARVSSATLDEIVNDTGVTRPQINAVFSSFKRAGHHVVKLNDGKYALSLSNNPIATSDDLFKAACFKHFGTHIQERVPDLLNDISAVVAARMFAGTNGDNPLCVLNRALNNVTKDMN